MEYALLPLDESRTVTLGIPSPTNPTGPRIVRVGHLSKSITIHGFEGAPLSVPAGESATFEWQKLHPEEPDADPPEKVPGIWRKVPA